MASRTRPAKWTVPLPGWDAAHVRTPDDTMDGAEVSGPVVIWDDDHFYMAGVMAEVLAKAGHTVTIVTSQASTAAFTQFTLELDHVHRRLVDLGVPVIGFHALAGIGEGEVDSRTCMAALRGSFPVAGW